MDKTFIRRHEEQNYTHNLLPEGTEKPTVPGDDHVMICLEVLGMHIDEDHLEDRAGEEGLLYNIHYQMNPEHVMKTGHDYAAEPGLPELRLRYFCRFGRKQIAVFAMLEYHMEDL